MINLRKRTAASFTAGILFIGVLAVSVPASAGGGGGGGGGSRGGPGRPPPPVFLEGSQAGRAVGTTCSIKSVSNRRVQVCN
jgi:hypothetical protein